MDGGEGPRPDLSFVIPVLDELDGLPALWRALDEAGSSLVARQVVRSWEVILVDDGSTDGSSALVDHLAADHVRCVVVHHPLNRGIGAALRSGVAAARGDVLVYTDADLPFDLRELEALLAPVRAGQVDIVSGRRIGRDREGRWRAVQSVAYNALVRAVLGLPVADVNFACKVFDRRAFPDHLSSATGFIDAEWLTWAHRHGVRIRQVPVEFLPRRVGRSTLGGPGDAVALLRELVQHRRRAGRRGPQPLGADDA